MREVTVGRALPQESFASALPYEEYFVGIAGREMEMNLESMIALAAAALLLIYLTYALLRPEKF
jgi:K+-transporting ATPase KdpF subunit